MSQIDQAGPTGQREVPRGEIVIERRKVRRLPVQVPVRCGGLATCTVNLTAGGTYLETRERPPLDAAIALELSLPDGGAPLALTGRVVRAGGTPEEPPGVGIEFIAVDRSAHDRLSGFVEGMQLDVARW